MTDKGTPVEAQKPAWVTWVPNKLGELKAFFVDVRSELKKVAWPGRQEVQSTTIVVIATTIFFGFYLWALDLGFTWLYDRFVSVVLK